MTYFLVVVYKNLLYNPNYFSGYGYTELLINFQGGFVRRGLLGELLYQICSATGVSPFVIIYGVCIVAWIGVVSFFIQKFNKNNWSWWILMSPMFLGATTNTIRKDYILYIILIIIFYLLSQRKNTINLLGVQFLICLGLMLHEAFIFFGIPIVLLFLLTKKSTRTAGILISIISISVFLILCKFKGNTEIADSIYNSWNSIIPHGELIKTSNNSIGAIGWETIKTMNFHLKVNFTSVEFGKFTIIPRILVALLAYYLFTNFLFVFRKQDKKEAFLIKQRISILYIISFISLLPMFTVLSCDYGRLYQYILISTFSALILLPGDRIDSLLPETLTTKITSFNNYLDKILIPSKGLLVLLLFIVTITPYHFYINEAIGYSIFSTLCHFPYFLINLINA